MTYFLTYLFSLDTAAMAAVSMATIARQISAAKFLAQTPLPLRRQKGSIYLLMNLMIYIRVEASQSYDSQKFSEYLLKIDYDKETKKENGKTKLFEEFCKICPPLKSLIDCVYPKIETYFLNSKWLEERAILTPLNEKVQEINNTIQEMIQGPSHIILSIDKCIRSMHNYSAFCEGSFVSLKENSFTNIIFTPRIIDMRVDNRIYMSYYALPLLQMMENGTELFGKGTISESQCREWFTRFKSGDTSLEDKSGRVWPSDFGDQSLLVAVEKDESLTI